MKKAIALLLSMTMVFSLAACGKKETAGTGTAKTEAAKTEAAAQNAPKAAAEEKKAPAAEPMKIDIASLYTENTVCDDACIKLTELMNASGLFEVVYYNNSQLGSLYDQIESLLSGTPIIALGGGSKGFPEGKRTVFYLYAGSFAYDYLCSVPVPGALRLRNGV